ncbi:dehydrogenase E1 component subunit alpha/beta [Vibrio splendidus]|uniref:dehydrogenase E1 component subunit alpha/beta n=1 Tax=Vibrio splendidus TaxID=29497 RepID=UPI000769E310|nr:alpha-ketoacid dehydrogenase subunit alpha/beta [Vibrio splendidus]
MRKEILKEALLIRRTEEKLLELFGQGQLNGTVHTCIGEELSAIAFAGQLSKDDFIFSNHRCHGHYLAYTKDTKGLLAELMGRKEGTCSGVGSSQHLCEGNFFSNGIQGGIVPVAAGMALANKLKKNNRIGTVFIGDGTLGQGVIYEAMNMAGKWGLPLVIVCEDNGYAQTTVKEDSFAGDLKSRAEGFGLEYRSGNTWEFEKLISDAKVAYDEVRKTNQPIFFHVKTYRLAPHSKGDDTREVSEVEKYAKLDPINICQENDPKLFQEELDAVDRQIDEILNEISKNELSLEEYSEISEPGFIEPAKWTDIEPSSKRMVDRLNLTIKEIMANERSVFIGEDVLSPYGGAFKVAKDLSVDFPERVLSTPISEAGLVGVSNGLALSGMKPYAEIMFGDFVLLALDQIVNHASKFYHMYNKQITCPLVIRTPMGGGRGYGPTHSQTLDKFLIGIDNVKTVALNKFLDPKYIYDSVDKEIHPVIVIENKVDYGSTLLTKPKLGFSYQQSDSQYPVVKISPKGMSPDITIVSYGGAASIAESVIHELFTEYDIAAEVIIPSQLSPLDISEIIESAKLTNAVYILEEGSLIGGFGSEVSSAIHESCENVRTKRIGSLPIPIPSVKNLEASALLNSNQVIQTIIKGEK